MRPAVAVALALAAVTVALVLRAPAAVVVDRAFADSPSLSFASASGTLWRGAMAGVRYRGIDVGAVEWRFGGIDLAHAGLRYRLRVYGPELSATGTATLKPLSGTLGLSDLTGRMRPHRLLALSGQDGIALGGEVALSLAAAELSGEPPHLVTATGQAVWSNAALEAPLAIDLGELTVDLVGRAEGGFAARIEGAGGDVTLDGEALVEANGRYRVDLALAVLPAVPESVRTMIALVAPSNESGIHRFQRDGNLLN